MLILSSKNYYSCKSNVLVDNKIETVSGSVYDSAPPSTIYENTFDKNIDSNNTMNVVMNKRITSNSFDNTVQSNQLPNLNGNNTIYFSGTAIGTQWDATCNASYYASYTILTGKIKVTLDTRILGNLAVSCKGRYDYKVKDKPSDGDGADSVLANFIKNINKDASSLYGTSWFNDVSATIRDLSPTDWRLGYVWEQKPNESPDVINVFGKRVSFPLKWSDELKQGWKENNSYYQTRNASNETYLLSNSLFCNITKTGDNTFEIDYKMTGAYSLVRYSYRNYYGAYWYTGYGYVFLLNSLQFSVSGVTLGSETIDFAYSLIDGMITSNVSNNYPIKIETNTLETNDATFGEDSWKEGISKALLIKYANGKLIAEANVKAQWILDNNVHINTQMQIKDLQGKLITRKGQPITFEVKHIEKTFNASQYRYKLKLLEV